MHKMKGFVLIIYTLSLLVKQIPTQKYRDVHLKISSEKTYYSIIQHGFNLTENRLLFAAKYCGNGLAFVKFFDHAGQLLLYVAIHANEPVVALQKIGSSYNRISIPIEYGLTCNVFEQYKLGWKNGYFALWRKVNRMWVLLIHWQDPNPNIDSVADIHVASQETFDGEWKIYIAEHSTVPFRTTCGKF